MVARRVFPVLILGLVAACSSHPWWYRSGPSSCGFAMWMRVAHQVSGVGGCGGELSTPPQVVTMHLHGKLYLHTFTVTRHSHDPVVVLPTSTDAAVLREVRRTGDGLDTTYEAVAQGSVLLMSPHAPCEDSRLHRPVKMPCAVLRVNVT